MDSLLQLAADPAAWAALVTLVVMEIVLGIDNLVFISILSNKLPEAQRPRARSIGLSLALLMRIALLFGIAWLVALTNPVVDLGLTGDVIEAKNKAISSFGAAIVQILMLDLVFSIDSILTAVGMTHHVPIMIIAVTVAVAAMFFAAGPLANFIHNNPTIVMLALGFLLMIGAVLIADGFGIHVPKGYIYAAMAFSGLVEGLNMVARKSREKAPAKTDAPH